MSNDQLTNSDEISLKELFQKIAEWYRYLKSQWIKIALVGFIGGCIGFVYAWRQPITYTAKLTFVVEEGKSGGSSMGGLASLAGSFGLDMGGSSGGSLLFGDNIFLYFKSLSLTREVLLSQYDSNSNKSLADIYADVYKLKEGWKKNEKIGDIKFQPISLNKPYTRLQDSLLQKITEAILATNLSVARTDKKAGFIEVRTTMENEILAKVYCERTVKKAVDQYISVKTQRQKTTVDKLQARVDSVAVLLNQKTSSSANLQTASSTMDINPLYSAGTVIATETTLRDKTMLANIFASAIQNLELAKFTLSQETPVIEVVDEPVYPLKKTKTSRLKMAIWLAFGFGSLIVVYLVVRRVLTTLV
jgi:hypothetical protein